MSNDWKPIQFIVKEKRIYGMTDIFELDIPDTYGYIQGYYDSDNDEIVNEVKGYKLHINSLGYAIKDKWLYKRINKEQL